MSWSPVVVAVSCFLSASLLSFEVQRARQLRGDADGFLPLRIRSHSGHRDVSSTVRHTQSPSGPHHSSLPCTTGQVEVPASAPELKLCVLGNGHRVSITQHTSFNSGALAGTGPVHRVDSSSALRSRGLTLPVQFLRGVSSHVVLALQFPLETVDNTSLVHASVPLCLSSGVGRCSALRLAVHCFGTGFVQVPQHATC